MYECMWVNNRSTDRDIPANCSPQYLMQVFFPSLKLFYLLLKEDMKIQFVLASNIVWNRGMVFDFLQCKRLVVPTVRNYYLISFAPVFIPNT